MSKLIPPLMSTTPPPIGIADTDDNEDDEFGDFAAADDTTYGCDSFSIPNTPEDSPIKTHNALNTDPQIPELIDEEITKDYQDKRKNVDKMHDTLSINSIEVPNVPVDDSIAVCVTNSLTNGHNCNDVDIKSTDLNIESTIEVMDVPTDVNDDDVERPPQLFDDDSEREEISETPSNFSISFDDNVICDDEEEEEIDIPIELPNHVENLEMVQQKVPETCKNIQEFDDFDDEWEQADKQAVNGLNEETIQSQDKSEDNDKFEDCEESLVVHNQCETVESEILPKDEDEFGDFNTFASVPSIPLQQSEEILENIEISNVSCDKQSNINGSNDSSVNIVCEVEMMTNDDAASTNQKQDSIEDEEFDDFQFTESSTKPLEIKDNEPKTIDIDDFADFASAPIQFPPQTLQNEVTSQPIQRSVSLEQDDGHDDDDFGDFDDYTTSTTSTNSATSATLPTNTIPLLNPDKVYEETQVIFKVMFESVAPEETDYEYSDATVKSAIFSQIKDVTETHALRYNWGKSQVQQGLLKALNIDTRNILYAHGMPMPKFAANLSMAPLEPIRSEVLTPTPAPLTQSPLIPSSVSSSSNSQVTPHTQQNGEIPAAQFDWGASGLANPLDSNQTSTLFDLEQLAASLSMPTSTTCAVGVDSNHAGDKVMKNIDEDWDLWLQSVSKEETKPTPRTSRTSDDIKFEDTSHLQTQKPITYDSESVNSLQFPEMVEDVDESKPQSLETDDFSDFTSFQSNNYPQTQQIDSGWSTSNMIPLRETYIDDVRSENGAKSNNHSRKSSYESMGRPEQPKEEAGWLQPTILTPVLSHKERITPSVETQAAVGGEDDDFADFQDFQTSSIPAVLHEPTTQCKVKTTENNSTKLQELPKSDGMKAFGGNLLNPTVLQPTLLEPVKLNAAMEPQAILWPDPGITEEELARFDMYAKKDGNYSNTTPSTLVSSSETILSMSSSVPSSASSNKAPETKLSGTGGSLMVERHVVVPANKVILPFNEVLLPPNNQVVISKDLVLPILESSPRKYSPQQKTPQSQQPVVVQDDDDWSDFISTKPSTTPTASSGKSATSGLTGVTGISGSNASPSKLASTLSSTSTSELSLSIPQLRSMQNMQPPNKPPIPVITPHGLVQTKIPMMSPSTPIKSLPQTALHVQPPVDGYQPAIISTQFAAQLNLNSNFNNHSQTPFSGFLQNGHYQTTSIPSQTNSATTTTNGRTPQSPPKKLNGLHDDDEWSDFMSSQPVNTGNHSLYTPTLQSLQTLQPGNLAHITPPMTSPSLYGGGGVPHSQMRSDYNRNGYPSDLPNIITNPVHFQSYPMMNTPTNVLNKKSTHAQNGILHSNSKNKKPQNLNVARLPDLDFAAPKTNVFHHNNKK